jgi:hypothetical protein
LNSKNHLLCKKIFMFKPSKELWQILIYNGFKNVSYQYIKEHNNFYDGPKELYDPRLHKVAFAMVKSKSKFVIYFEYNDIEIVFGGKSTIIREANLTENQLRSIIAFFKGPYYRRYSIIDITETRIENSWEIFEENKKHDSLEFPFDKKFEKIFNECKIIANNSL